MENIQIACDRFVTFIGNSCGEIWEFLKKIVRIFFLNMLNNFLHFKSLCFLFLYVYVHFIAIITIVFSSEEFLTYGRKNYIFTILIWLIIGFVISFRTLFAFAEKRYSQFNVFMFYMVATGLLSVFMAVICMIPSLSDIENVYNKIPYFKAKLADIKNSKQRIVNFAYEPTYELSLTMYRNLISIMFIYVFNLAPLTVFYSEYQLAEDNVFDDNFGQEMREYQPREELFEL